VYLAVNRSGHALLGYDDGELVGKRIADVTPAHDASRVKEAIEAVARGEIHSQIWSLLRKDGSLKQLEVLAQRLSNDTIFAVVRDLVARHESEREIQTSEAQLRSIMHTVPDTIMSVDRDGRILFINRSEAPYETHQIVGTSCYDYVPPESRERVERAIDRVCRSRGIDEYEIEGPPGADGVRRLYSVRAGPIIEHGEVVAVTLCATDVTDRKQAEKTRKRLEEQLVHAQKMEIVGQLAGGVAHDFNNLLTVVTSLVELAYAEAPGTRVSEHLDGIRTAAARGSALTQQLLAFARKKIVQPEAVDLGAVLRRMTPMVSSVVGEHITVELALDDALSTVHVDVGGLERVIMNLVVNARDAMPEGGRLLFRTWHTILEGDLERHPDLKPGRYGVLDITDTGTGMPPEVLARVFEPFFTTKPPGAGSGLGLAMCHGIVTQAGGTITLSTELGRGTTFHVYLPCSPRRSASIPAPVARTTERPKTGSETLLVVEDEPMILRLACTALERLGYRVLTASNGLEALEVAASESGRIDLIITDVVMPKLGGRELARRLAEQRPDTKVLYTSGYAEKAIAFGGVLSEGVHFIEKPYSLGALAERVRKIIDQG
jgi:PAS domain S-box-containing protein